MNYQIKKVEGYEDYLIDTEGNLWSKVNGYKQSGYIKASLASPEGIKYTKIHQIVARNFLSNPNNLPHVCHIDGDGTNNNVDNLYWGTPKENEADKERHGRRQHGEDRSLAKLCEKQVRVAKHCINLKVPSSIISKMLNVTPTVIWQIARGISWKHIII